MVINGPVWVPPPLPAFDKQAAIARMNQEVSEKEKQKDHKDLEYFRVSGQQDEEGEEILRLPYQLKREFLGILEGLGVNQDQV